MERPVEKVKGPARIAQKNLEGIEIGAKATCLFGNSLDDVPKPFDFQFDKYLFVWHTRRSKDTYQSDAESRKTSCSREWATPSYNRQPISIQ